MKRAITHAVGGLALTLGVGAGCGGTMPPAQATSDPKAVSAAVEQDIERLRALEVFDVGNLVLNLPAAATACYGVPCPGSGLQAAYEDERARQAARLDRLVAIAETTAQSDSLPPHAASEAAAAAQALADLQVIQVAGLVETQPAHNPSCYNLPCPSDRQAAEAANARRVTVAFGIAAAAKESGL